MRQVDEHSIIQQHEKVQEHGIKQVIQHYMQDGQQIHELHERLLEDEKHILQKYYQEVEEVPYGPLKI